MKTKNIIFLLVMFMALVFSGCGKKENKAGSSSSRYGNAFRGLDGAQSDEVRRLMDQYPCSRLEESFSDTRSSGQFLQGGYYLQKGEQASGTVTNVYAGINYSVGDIIIVKTMSDGGFNATVSLCIDGQQIKSGDTFERFKFNYNGATLRTNTGCSIGQVVTNKAMFDVGFGAFPTTFEGMRCN